MEIEFSLRALNDLDKWRKSGNTKIQHKITELSNSILKTPFDGIGKPEPLKHEMAGLWSRRNNKSRQICLRSSGTINYCSLSKRALLINKPFP